MLTQFYFIALEKNILAVESKGIILHIRVGQSVTSIICLYYTG